MVNELLKRLTQFRDRPGRLLVCATNSVRDLDTAFLRHARFHYVLPVGPPDDKARGALWTRYVDDSDIDTGRLVEASVRYTPADVAHVARAVAQATFERTADTGTRCRATDAGYVAVIEGTRPTLTDKQVAQFVVDVNDYARRGSPPGPSPLLEQPEDVVHHLDHVRCSPA